ncbi:MAG: N(1)-aminopropylagmatine ureohydrolase [Syntrophorhabdus sp. PtaU1.Bin058]|nr:MAG: N(1)-aminopropylagmatine ureohydrolase [Syntrophorhabdus sp. PtaU1.Bin058]
MPRPPSIFCGLPDKDNDYAHAFAVILPIPFDKTSTWLKGADKGPAAIIEASPYLEFYDIETGSEVLQRGIFTARPIRAASSPDLIRKTDSAVSKYLKDNKLVVTLGGEHSVSIGVIKSYARHYKDLSILHLDAHADSRESYEGSPYNHACVIARARESVRNIVSVGIRSMDVSELPGIDRKRMFFAHRIYNSDTWIDNIVRLLTGSVYITIDLDVFDPGIMPSTGTPEPGGLSWYQVMKLLSAVARAKRIVGFDVVELCPSRSRAPDFLAAKLIYTLLSYIDAYTTRKNRRAK